MLIPVWFSLVVNAAMWLLLMVLSYYFRGEAEKDDRFNMTMCFVMLMISCFGTIFLRLFTNVNHL